MAPTQVANYGVGGQYEPHFDFSRVSFIYLFVIQCVCVCVCVCVRVRACVPACNSTLNIILKSDLGDFIWVT